MRRVWRCTSIAAKHGKDIGDAAIKVSLVAAEISTLILSPRFTCTGGLVPSVWSLTAVRHTAGGMGFLCIAAIRGCLRTSLART